MSNFSLIVDGEGRWRSGVRNRLWIEVAAAFSEQLRTAGVFTRWMLWLKIHREIEKRIDEIAPSPESLY